MTECEKEIITLLERNHINPTLKLVNIICDLLLENEKKIIFKIVSELEKENEETIFLKLEKIKNK